MTNDIVIVHFVYSEDVRTLYGVNFESEDEKYFVTILSLKDTLNTFIPNKDVIFLDLLRKMLKNRRDVDEMLTTLTGIYSGISATAAFSRVVMVAPYETIPIGDSKYISLAIVITPVMTVWEAEQMLKHVPAVGNDVTKLDYLPIMKLDSKEKMEIYPNSITDTTMITLALAKIIEYYDEIYSELRNIMPAGDRSILHKYPSIAGLVLFVQKLAMLSAKRQKAEFEFLMEILDHFETPPSLEEAEFLTSNIQLE